jgi:hypothetical protein
MSGVSVQRLGGPGSQIQKGGKGEPQHTGAQTDKISSQFAGSKCKFIQLQKRQVRPLLCCSGTGVFMGKPSKNVHRCPNEKTGFSSNGLGSVLTDQENGPTPVGVRPDCPLARKGPETW